MQQYFEQSGRPVAVVNLDPANDDAPYSCAVDVRELISLGDVAEELDLGPNGGTYIIYYNRYHTSPIYFPLLEASMHV